MLTVVVDGVVVVVVVLVVVWIDSVEDAEDGEARSSDTVLTIVGIALDVDVVIMDASVTGSGRVVGKSVSLNLISFASVVVFVSMEPIVVGIASIINELIVVTNSGSERCIVVLSSLFVSLLFMLEIISDLTVVTIDAI